MATATPIRTVREAKRNVREPRRNVRELNVREPQRNVRELSIGDADLLILDEVISFEDTDSREHQACLPEPYPTATTRLNCEL